MARDGNRLRINGQLANEQRVIDGRIGRAAASDEAMRRLTTIPGLGLAKAVSLGRTIDEPERFTSSPTVGAHLGLAPRRHRSGEVGWTGRVARRGGSVIRAVLHEAANMRVHRPRRSCAIERCDTAPAGRIGMRRAKVAQARGLSVVMHAIRARGATFDWGGGPPAAAGT